MGECTVEKIPMHVGDMNVTVEIHSATITTHKDKTPVYSWHILGTDKVGLGYYTRGQAVSSAYAALDIRVVAYS